MTVIHPETIYKDLMMPGSFIGSTLAASGIKNSLIIFHGIAGCNIEAVHFRSDQIPGGRYVPVIPTGLNESDCIYGGAEKLSKTINDSLNQALSINKLPEILFIITSDAPSIVGDDINSAARFAEETFGVKTIALDVPGFLGGIASGTDACLLELLNKFSVKKSEKKQRNKVNIIAPYMLGSKNWTNDTDEIVRLLELSGISVNLNLCRNFSLAKIQDFSDAKFNLNFSGEELPGFEKASFKLGGDNYPGNLPIPLGVANTEEWLLKLASDIGDLEQAKAALVSDQKFVQSQLRFNYNFSWMSTLMHGKRCGLLASAKFGASLARCLLWDFGIIPKVIGLVAETEKAKIQALELLEEIKNQADCTVLINPSYYDYGKALQKSQVDFSIGSIHDKPLSLGYKIPHLSLCGFNFYNQYNFVPFPLVGVRGVLNLLTELSKLMEDTFYLKDSIAAFNYEQKSD